MKIKIGPIELNIPINEQAVRKELGPIETEYRRQQNQVNVRCNIDVLSAATSAARSKALADPSDENLESLLECKAKLLDARLPGGLHAEVREVLRRRLERFSVERCIPATLPIFQKAAAEVRKIAEAQLEVEAAQAAKFNCSFDEKTNSSEALKALLRSVADREEHIAAMLKEKDGMYAPSDLLRAAGLDIDLACDARPAAKA